MWGAVLGVCVFIFAWQCTCVCVCECGLVILWCWALGGNHPIKLRWRHQLKALQSLQLFTGLHWRVLLQRALSDIPADVNRILQDSLAELLTLCPHPETMAWCSIPNMLGQGLFRSTNKRVGAWPLLDDYKPRFGGNLTLPKNTQYQE